MNAKRPAQPVKREAYEFRGDIYDVSTWADGRVSVAIREHRWMRASLVQTTVGTTETVKSPFAAVFAFLTQIEAQLEREVQQDIGDFRADAGGYGR